ncbi:hypothetical protein [uncultured Methanobrevibacter sp.]|uniref:hypothetical protein n=1 Tax=uncultured Methanobrevibacter sp. TaxID=253161 RepID=UPI0025E0CFE0|nr:hypothetical protein [uncultured Methanobrevibacter sp.]
MDRVNSDESYFLEKYEQEIINCCKKAMSNKEVIELLKTKYGREIPLTTYRKFKARLKLTKGDFLETLLDEIKVMKTQGATDESVRRWLADEHEFEVSRATFSRFKKKYNLVDNEKDSRARDKGALTNRAIAQKQITDNNVHQDNIDLAIDNILQQQVIDIKTGLENLDKITKNAVGIEIDFEKLDHEIRHNANEKSLARYLLDLTELKIRYLELSVKAFDAKNKLFKDEMDRLFQNRILELEDKKIELSQKDMMEEIEILAKQIDDNDV